MNKQTKADKLAKVPAADVAMFERLAVLAESKLPRCEFCGQVAVAAIITELGNVTVCVDCAGVMMDEQVAR